jgi:FtsP/CotA-like multicopper oxidase with cupredoxin domain
MKLSRRNMMLSASAATLAKLAATDTASAAAPVATTSTGAAPRAGSYRPVRTPNGWTLPYTMRGGVKEFHLVAEEVEHEFGPGSKAKCWGYNGSTPGPTIEAVEGDRVRILVTNRLGEHTTVHWHGLLLPSGMDGVGGLYHPHADEMTQMAFGMMGLFIIHPRVPDTPRVDRDYAILLHNWALHPGTYRPDPSIMTDFDVWTFNSKAFPAIESLVAATGERVRIRVGNLSMWNHPIHIHGPRFWITGGDGGRLPPSKWRPEVTEIVGVGQTRDFEFDAVAGDWAMHCHMSHHTMNAMGHDIPNTVGVDQSGVAAKMNRILPNYMAMGQDGMAEHQSHFEMGHMPGPANTMPMMTGTGPHGNLEMGGMFTVIKVRDGLRPGDYSDPGWYPAPAGTVAQKVSSDPDFGTPVRRKPPA